MLKVAQNSPDADLFDIIHFNAKIPLLCQTVVKE